jgi:hypothetical protein
MRGLCDSSRRSAKSVLSSLVMFRSAGRVSISILILAKASVRAVDAVPVGELMPKSRSTRAVEAIEAS